MIRKTCLERAYELAQSGTASSVTALKKQLLAEGYNANEIFGAGLIKSLSDAIRKANGLPVRAAPVKRPLLTAEERSAAARRAAATRYAERRS